MKLATRKNIRKSGAVFNIGDEVFYKRDDKLAWEGPRRVVGQDGLVVFIWHNSHYIRAHSCWVQLTNPSLDNNNLSQTSNAILLAQTNAPPSLDIPEPQPLTDTAVDTDNEYETLQMTPMQMNVEIITSQMKIKRKTVLLSMKMEVLLVTKLKPNLEISFPNKWNKYCTAKVISQAGKSNGKYVTVLNTKLLIICMVYKHGIILRTYLM